MVHERSSTTKHCATRILEVRALQHLPCFVGPFRHEYNRSDATSFFHIFPRGFVSAIHLSTVATLSAMIGQIRFVAAFVASIVNPAVASVLWQLVCESLKYRRKCTYNKVT